MPENDILTRLLSVDRRILYWILVALILIPLLHPLGFPIPVTSATKAFYNGVEAIPANSVVILDVSVGAIAWAELGPAIIATTRFLIERNLRVIMWSATAPDAPLIAELYLLKYFQDAGKVYGKDYVLIGYVPGAVTALATLAKNVEYARNDFYGTPLSAIPMLANVHTAHDIAAVVLTESGGEGGYYVQQWYAPYHTVILDVCTGALISERLIAYNAGQIKGIVGGSRGGAELELLTGLLGTGVALADALSITHMYLLILIIMGNLAFFLVRSKSGREKK
jgi:hypothetical protein